MDYIKGIIFIILFVYMLARVGNFVNKNKQSFCKDFLFGYLIYTCFQALGGIVTQLLSIDFKIYQIYMIIMLGLLTIIAIKNTDWKHLLKQMSTHFSKYFILYGIAFVLLLMNIFTVDYLWMSNHLDDGWYLLKVAQAPYLGGNYNINYATGFDASLGLVRSINTFELDYAFWSYTLGIYPTVFCKAIMSYFNYFLVINIFAAFLDYLKTEDNKWKYLFLLPMIIFGLGFDTLSGYGIITQQDSWHFSSAIWYGSALVRCLTPLAFFIPLMDIKELNFKYIVIYVMTCICLFSKASQALPIVLIMSIYIGSYFVRHSIKNRWFVIALHIMLVICLLYVPHLFAYNKINEYVLKQYKVYFTSPLIIASIIMLLISFIILRKNQFYFEWLISLIFMYLLIFCPGLNNLFLDTAMYTFVAGRTITLLSFFTVITAFISFGCSLSQININFKLLASLYLMICIVVLGIYGLDHRKYNGVKKSIALLVNNPRLIPESSIILSKELNNLSKKYDDLYVMSPAWVFSYGYAHSLCVNLRLEAPTIHSLSGIHRFPEMKDDGLYNDFDVKKQATFETFMSDPNNEERQLEMKTLLSKYPTDVIITTSDAATDVLETKFGFSLYNTITYKGEAFSYFIYLKN